MLSDVRLHVAGILWIVLGMGVSGRGMRYVVVDFGIRGYV